LSFAVPFGRRRAARALSSLLAAAAAASVQAQSQPAETVTVTATRTPVRASEVVAEVTVIDRAQIENAQGQTLTQLLARQPGLQMSSNGGAGKTSSIFIRGLEARHTLLLVDGVPLGSVTVGTPSLDNLPLELVERIEIVRGPMTSLYGNGAMGGVIQLFTRRALQGLGASWMLAGGSQRQAKGAAGVSYGDGRFDLVANVQRSSTHGQSSTNPGVPFGSHNADDDGFQQNSGSVKLGWRLAPDWRAEALSLVSLGRTRIDDGPGADALAALRNRVHSLSVDGRFTAAWAGTLSATESVDEYDTEVSASAFATLGTVRSQQRRLALEQRVATPLGQALVLLERTEQVVSRPGQPFATSERDIDAAALGLSGAAAGHTWQASLRRDRNSQFGGVTTGALGYGYALTPAWRLLASAGSSHTIPSFNQLYFPNFGNPNLLPEKGVHGELGVQWSGDGQQLRAAYFQNRYRDFITAGANATNVRRAEIDGLSVNWTAQFDRLALDASVDHHDPRVTEGANAGNRLQRRARNAVRAGAEWTEGAWTHGAEFQAAGERFDDLTNTHRLGGYGTLALFTRWAVDRELTASLRLDNVGDKRYETARGYDQPHRSLLASLRWTMR
jgi:vitamin B12 transporter